MLIESCAGFSSKIHRKSFIARTEAKRHRNDSRFFSGSQSCFWPEILHPRGRRLRRLEGKTRVRIPRVAGSTPAQPVHIVPQLSRGVNYPSCQVITISLFCFSLDSRVRVLCTTSLTTDSRAPPRCPAPLDSGFRRNDGSCAQHPSAGMTGGAWRRLGYDLSSGVRITGKSARMAGGSRMRCRTW